MLFICPSSEPTALGCDIQGQADHISQPWHREQPGYVRRANQPRWNITLKQPPSATARAFTQLRCYCKSAKKTHPRVLTLAGQLASRLCILTSHPNNGL